MTVRTGRATKSRVARTAHTDDVLAVLFRLGGGTIEQVAGLLWYLKPGRWESDDGAYEAAKRTLRLARQEGLVEVLPVHREWIGRTSGRAETFYRLRRERGGLGIIAGAVAAGVSFDEPDEALDLYARHWYGGGVLHASHKVDYYLALLDAAAASEGEASVDAAEVSGESHPSYPLVGWPFDDVDAAGRPRRRGSRGTKKFTGERKYARVVPDGEARVLYAATGSAPRLACDYYVELERRHKTGVVEDKIQRYAGHWRRVIEDEGSLEVRPLVIVHHDERRSSRSNPREGAGAPAMRDALHARLVGGSGHFTELQRTIKSRDPYAALGRMVLVADWHDVLREGALGRVYHPVSPYPESKGGTLIDLRAAAWERDRASRAYLGGGG